MTTTKLSDWRHANWYTDGDGYIVALTGQPQESVQIGIGSSPIAAWRALESTPIQSAGHDCGLEAAIRWATYACWIDRDIELIPIEAPIEPEEVGSSIDLCECGCGDEATKTVLLLREQDRGTAEALGWAECAVAPMRVPVRCADGHSGEVEGYVDEEVQS